MRTVAYTVAILGQLATFGGAIMLGRRLAALGAGRVGAADALLDLATGPTAAWFWSGLIAALVWAGAWRLAERHARPGARDATGRKALLYIGQLAALGGLIFQAILLITTLLTQPRPANAGLSIVELAVGAALALAFWGFLRWIAVSDGDFGQKAASAAGWRRFYYYTAAAGALALFLTGLMELLRIILAVMLGLAAPAVGDRGRFALAAAFALVAAPTWWALWWRQQARITVGGMTAMAERRAPARRLYLYAVILLSAVAFFFGLGMSIFGATMGRDLALVAGWAPIALVALICLVGHLWTLQGDERALRNAPEEAGRRRGQEAVHPETGQSRRTESGRPGAPAAGPRRFVRAELPSTAGPSRPIILVVDGGDGAVGAQVLAGLAAGLPHALLWPWGLNAAAQVALLNALAAAPPVVPADAPARATLIIGPADMLIAGGLAGEVSSELAAAIAASPAAKLLLPPRDPTLRWVAAPDWPLERWVENAVIEAVNALNVNR